MRQLAILSALLLVPAAASATEYRLPLNGCDTATKCLDVNKKCYVTAYMDLDGAATNFRDWNCGQNTYDGHQGTDIAIGGWAEMDAPGGSRPVIAAANGTVVVAVDGQNDRSSDFSLCGTAQAAGNHVAIRHPNGLTTVYLHMKKGSVLPKVGDNVQCGDKLGEVGSSGCSTGPHLHFEVNTSSTLFANPDDPFASKTGCGGGPVSYWVDQGAYCTSPGACCKGGCTDNATFVSETIPDGTAMQPGATFTKKWTIRNSGSTTWTSSAGYQWVFDKGEQMGGAAVSQLGGSESIAPGATKEWSLSLKAPTAPGRYRGYWRMERTGAARFGDEMWVEIVVNPPAGTKDHDQDGHNSIAEGGQDCDDLDPMVFPGAQELCNGRDDDCDGATDEDLVESCGNACGGGTRQCVGGKFGACSAPQGKPESCNGEDDDCDGDYDEGELCSSGLVCLNGACRPRPQASDAGTPPPPQDAGSTTLPQEPVAPGSPVAGGGCGCGAGTGEPAAFALLLLIGAALLARRRYALAREARRPPLPRP